MADKADPELTLTREVARVTKALNQLESQREWSAYAHPWKFLFFSFLNGLMVALGSTLGLALVLYLLNLLGYLPIIGEVFTFLRQSVHK